MRLGWLGGVRGGDGERDGVGDVFHECVRLAEVAKVGVEKNGEAAVVEAFEEGEEAVARVVWAEEDGETQDGDGELVGVIEEGLFDVDFFVGVVGAVEMAGGAEGGGLVEGCGGGGGVFGTEEAAVEGVDIVAGDDDGAAGVSGEGVDGGGSVAAGHGDHVDDDIIFLLAEEVAVEGEGGEVGVDFFDVGREGVDAMLAAMEDADVVALGGELAYDMGAGKSGAAEN